MNPPAARAGFWRRRVVEPVLGLLRQGLTPDRIAFSLGIGTACSLFPFLGFTSLLNLGVGLWLRLNQPLLQALNQLLGPVQLLLILVYVRIGEWLWRTEPRPLSLAAMARAFREESLGAFLAQFGWAGVHAFSAWLVTSPLLAFLVYRVARPGLQRLASKPTSRA